MKLYVIAMLITLERENQNSLHEILTEYALVNSEEEAAGQGMAKAYKQFPISKGYTSHGVTIYEVGQGDLHGRHNLYAVSFSTQEHVDILIKTNCYAGSVVAHSDHEALGAVFKHVRDKFNDEKFRNHQVRVLKIPSHIRLLARFYSK